jgi:hypothetical protein
MALIPYDHETLKEDVKSRQNYWPTLKITGCADCASLA